MSQDELDRFFRHLEEHPEERGKVRELYLMQLVKLAREQGFAVDADDFLARQALVHLIEGT